MADENKNNGVNTPEEETKKKGFKETAKAAWTWLTTNPVTKTAGKILLAAGLIGTGAFLGGVGVGIKEEHQRNAKNNEGETVILPDPEYVAPETEEVVETSFEEAPEEEPAETE